MEPDEVLDGDGYSQFLKPFRTIEDCHVHAALCGYLLRIARSYDFDEPALTDLAAHTAAIRGLAQADALSPGVHFALHGVLSRMREWLTRSERLWERVDPPVRQAWERDKALLNVAARARAARLEAARRALAAGPTRTGVPSMQSHEP